MKDLEQLIKKHKKKVTSTLAAVLFAVGIGGTQLNCSLTPTNIAHTLDIREKKIIKGINEISDSVYCLRNEAKYRSENSLEDSVNHGTAFAYRHENGYTYLITNAHIVHNTNLRFDNNHPHLKIYNKISEKFSLVDNSEDKDSSNDIKIEVVAKDIELDIAIIKTKEKLPISNAYSIDPSLALQAVDEVYLIGYPRGLLLAVTKGTVANPHHRLDNNYPSPFLDVTSTFGNSGSPYFIKRGDKLYWGGIVDGILPYRDNKATLLSTGIPIQKFNHLLKLK